MKIGIIADTLTDTAMGKAYFEKFGFETVCRAVKKDSRECFEFFHEPKHLRDEYILGLLREIKAERIGTVAIYANSICGYVDFDEMAKLTDLRIVTPFHAYKEIAKTHKKPCVLAVTSAALLSIENAMVSSNPKLDFFGVCRLKPAELIESGCTPDEVIESCALRELLIFCEAAKFDSIILGCTHFPYLLNRLCEYTDIEIIDPCDIMRKAVCQIERN